MAIIFLGNNFSMPRLKNKYNSFDKIFFGFVFACAISSYDRFIIRSRYAGTKVKIWGLLNKEKKFDRKVDCQGEKKLD